MPKPHQPIKDCRVSACQTAAHTRGCSVGWFEYLPVSLLLGETLPRETPPAAMRSVVYPQTGIALLRSDESPGYWTSAGLVAVQQLGRNSRRMDFAAVIERLRLLVRRIACWHACDSGPLAG